MRKCQFILHVTKEGANFFMSDKKILEVWRDPNMDRAIEDVIDIFTNVDGVLLVRLSGMTKRFAQVSGKFDVPPEAVDNIIRKLNSNNIINFDYITKCRHCGEISYIIKHEPDFLTKPKMCDTCQTFYSLLDGDNLEIIKK